MSVGDYGHVSRCGTRLTRLIPFESTTNFRAVSTSSRAFATSNSQYCLWRVYLICKPSESSSPPGEKVRPKLPLTTNFPRIPTWHAWSAFIWHSIPLHTSNTRPFYLYQSHIRHFRPRSQKLSCRRPRHPLASPVPASPQPDRRSGPRPAHLQYAGPNDRSCTTEARTGRPVPRALCPLCRARRSRQR